jgi:O-antigen/teichoic acid export membrane protein
MQGRADETRLRRLFLEGTKGINLIGTMIGIFVIIIGVDVLVMWVGPDYRRQGPVLYAMVIFAYLFAVASVSSRYLIGTGQAKARAFIAIPDLLANLTFCVVGAYLWGQFGVALGNVLSLFIIECLIMIPYSCRKLGISLKQFMETGLLPALWPSLLMGVYLYFFRLVLPVSNWPVAFLCFGSSAFVFGATFLVFGASRDERRVYWLTIRELVHWSPGSDV